MQIIIGLICNLNTNIFLNIVTCENKVQNQKSKPHLVQIQNPQPICVLQKNHDYVYTTKYDPSRACINPNP